ncbi:hypothetical protein RND71_043265 [Anisodus tanguticus]|uniref:BRCT domain-containing protein n=1 Tax=Anisodus tanguticus TaxID=243964 RepID=A0AAE1UNH4_9SOLA|nr:hypothetical protein RND71_043265 [Anisodus tanguticus]
MAARKTLEVPKEALVFIIRSFGGKVSWDKYLGLGSTYDEDDESITHQIVDRNSIERKYINRQYVQPQWIFDSVNAKKLLPIEDYFPGVELPPHLSPFVEEKEGDYVPEEKEALKKYGSLKIKDNKEEDESSEIDSSDDDDDDEKINSSNDENDLEDDVEIDSEDNQKNEVKKMDGLISIV